MTDSKTAERKKLSVIKPGHWRVVIRLAEDQECYEGTGEHIGDNVWITSAEWPSREVADERGRDAELWGIEEHGFRILEFLESRHFNP